jgi:divalent metal cation (Fe/Co/Zn/Cd) transporter
MDSEIEKLDKKRMRYLELFLVGFFLFLILSLLRYFFRLNGLNEQPIGIAVLAGLFFCVGVIALSTYKNAVLARKIKSDPLLEEALNNEMVQSLETQSWKAAYIGAIAATSFFALVGFVYPVCDLVLVALTSIIAGAGAHRATFYFKYRSL